MAPPNECVCAASRGQETVGGFASNRIQRGTQGVRVHNCNPAVAIIHNSKTATSNSGIKVRVNDGIGVGGERRVGATGLGDVCRLSCERANFLCLFYLTR